MKVFLHILTIFTFSALLNNTAWAQTPSTCYEIESILADACGNVEGQNEMIRFRVGPNQLDASNMTINWPNLTWKGLIQNQQTQDSVAYINSTIQGCGYLIEPNNYILPPGANVLVFTSYNFTASAHSFANLNDTLYVLFQNSTISQGHFKNVCSSCGSRTTTLSFSTPAGCKTDTAIYYPDSLTSFNGNYDGGYIDFKWDDTARYGNQGCQPPILPFQVNAYALSAVGCPGDTLNLLSSVTGNIDTLFWWGGSGSFSSPDSMNTDYYAGSTDSSGTSLYLSAVDVCNDTLTDTIQLNIIQPPVASISLGGNDTICQGNTVTLTAGGNGGYQWSTGDTSQSITAGSSGNYTVTVSNNCGTDTATQYIEVLSAPNVSISASGTLLCPGDTILLSASGASNYSWSNGQSGDTIAITNPGNYYAYASNYCGSDTSSAIAIGSDSIPQANIGLSGNDTICQGKTALLTGKGNGNFLWSTGESSNTISVNSSGTYWLEVSNICGSDTAYQNIEVIPIVADFSISPVTGAPPLTVHFTNNSQNADSYDWDFGTGHTDTSTNPVYTYGNTGNYRVVLTAYNSEGCSDTAVYEFVEVRAQTYYEIPNIFSPNGDGTNDLFFVKSSGIESIHGKIFNRWGQLMYEWDKVNMSWDGTTFSGKEVSPGEYYYIIEITIDSKTKTEKGHITLIR